MGDLLWALWVPPVLYSIWAVWYLRQMWVMDREQEALGFPGGPFGAQLRLAAEHAAREAAVAALAPKLSVEDAATVIANLRRENNQMRARHGLEVRDGH